MGATLARACHTAVWTGKEMIIFGGVNYYTSGYSIGGSYLGYGGKYNPATNSWLVATRYIGPYGDLKWRRQGHSAVWTDKEMIIWGGLYEKGLAKDGVRYDPKNETFTQINPKLSNTPIGRMGHSAVWTGKEMIIWGGYYYPGDSYFNDGARYNPEFDSWEPISDVKIYRRAYHAAFWTRKEMIIWGGAGHFREGDGGYFGDGARYNPDLDSWSLISNENSPEGRVGFSAVWTGRKMIVWGGENKQILLNTGNIYDAVNDKWSNVLFDNNSTLSPRDGAYSVWTGKEMIIWGGLGPGFYDDPNIYLNDGSRYRPPRTP